MSYDFVAGDTLSSIELALVDQDDIPADLTGAAVTLRYRLLIGPTRVPGAMITRAMTFTDPTSGIVTYQLQQHDLLAGIMRCEVRIEYADGAITTSLEPFDFVVREGL